MGPSRAGAATKQSLCRRWARCELHSSRSPDAPAPRTPFCAARMVPGRTRQCDDVSTAVCRTPPRRTDVAVNACTRHAHWHAAHRTQRVAEAQGDRGAVSTRRSAQPHVARRRRGVRRCRRGQEAHGACLYTRPARVTGGDMFARGCQPHPSFCVALRRLAGESVRDHQTGGGTTRASCSTAAVCVKPRVRRNALMLARGCGDTGGKVGR